MTNQFEHEQSGSQQYEHRVEPATPEYSELMSAIDRGLVPNHHVTYIPVSQEQQLDQPDHFEYAAATDLAPIMATADVIICISRDEDSNPDYTDANPTHNIVLTPSGESNVDKSVELFKLAQANGNKDIKFISTGRMHNRQIKMMLALPVLAEAMGINAEDAYRIPELKFKSLLDDLFTPENIARLDLDSSDDALAPNYKALKAILYGNGDTNGLIDGRELDEDAMKLATEKVFKEYQEYPRVSTSQLMVERAIQAGVPLEVIYNEDGAVDTISNMINVAAMMSSLDDFAPKDGEKQKIVIVAGSDHLPRTTWIADHILPDNSEIVCVESPANLDAEAYAASCDRERLSFGKGSNWIGGTRDIAELNQIVEAGYFGVNRKTAEEIAKDVAAQALSAATRN